MTTKHTPGPWLFNGGSTGAVVRCGDPDDAGVSPWLVASVYGDREDCERDERMDANARLIAAAPELLEAAKSAEKAIDILWVSHHANRSDDALEKLRAAIAKATGEQA